MKSLNRLVLSCLAATVVAAGACAQQMTTPQGKTSDDVLIKIHKVEILNQLLPLFLTKTQINEKLLPAIEKARGQWKALLDEEDAILGKLSPQLDETITAAIEKQKYPSRELLTDIQSKTKSMALKRTLVQIQIVDQLDSVVKETLDTGQKKALLGSFAERFIDPTKKPDELTDDTKRQFFIRNVFMDPMCRELLIEIAKHLPEDPK